MSELILKTVRTDTPAAEKREGMHHKIIADTPMLTVC